MKTFTPSASPAKGGINFEEIKRTTDIVRVVESYGIALVGNGEKFVGLCPFHKDVKTPNLHVDRNKGVFHCFGCEAGGDVIRFVARKEGVDDKEAALKLLSQIPGVRRLEEETKLSPQPFIPDAQRSKLLQRVVGFYAKTLHGEGRIGLDYLKNRNLADSTMLEVFQVGYCNGTLHEALPKSGEIIEQLEAIGILDWKGKEVFAGRVTVPIFDITGSVVGLYARNVQPCDGKDRHRYLAGPHRGVFNGACAKTSQRLFITEAIFDAMALWQAGRETSPGQAGFKNVISLYGNKGWTPDHEALIRDNGIVEVDLCLDNDPAGRERLPKLAEKLRGIGVKEVHAVAWPDGIKDANEFFRKHTAAEFENLLKAVSPKGEDLSAVVLQSGTEAEQITMTSEGFVAGYDKRRYELFAIEKPSPSKLKATIKALPASDSYLLTPGAKGRFHIDTVYFFLSRSRRNFIVEAARLFQDTPEIIEADLNKLTLQVASYAEKRLEEKTPRITLVSESEKVEGLRLGKNADLVDEILRDIAKLGMVGEKDNALVSYLTMTSRKMEDPLALLTISCSGAGKSHLQDTVLSLCPPEDLIKVTGLSDQALFYKGEDSLKHKVLAIEEEEGSMGADYAIRNLISSKKLVREATIKNPMTGRMETQVSCVNGPASVMKTTTKPDTNAETKSRFFIISVDESAQQTRAIMEAQRNSHTLEAMLRKKQREAIIKRHHAFQRMLKPIAVINPFEPFLSYGDDRLLFRRDHPKYLHLILAIAFLHQMQRPVKHHPEIGNYMEVTLDDIAIANDLALALFGSSLDDLSSPSRDLHRIIADFVCKETTGKGISREKFFFNRRTLREASGWADTRLRTYLAELLRLEYILPVSGSVGSAYQYRLICTPEEVGSEGRFVAGLKSVEQVRTESNLAGNHGHLAPTSQAQNREVKNGHFHSENGNGNGNLAGFAR